MKNKIKILGCALILNCFQLLAKHVQILIMVSIALLCGGYNTMAQNMEKLGEYTFIRHDSIPMLFSDSVLTCSGHKIATTKLTTKDFLYYNAALSPAYPLTQVYFLDKNMEEEREEIIKYGGCFDLSKGIARYCINYKTIINGDTIRIGSHEKFCELFAPVDNIQEAIAFAYIFTDSKPMYNLDFLKPFIVPQYNYFEVEDFEKIHLKKGKTRINTIIRKDSIRIVPPTDKGWEVLQPHIISSYGKETDDGYELLLYRYVLFGCLHPYERLLIKVTFNGKVKILEKCDAFENKRERNVCAD